MTISDRAGTRPAPEDFAAAWAVQGHVTDLDGPVHWIEFSPGQEGTQRKPPIVFVHGLGGSHLNWCLIGPALAAGRRAVALDLHGFGLTPGSVPTVTVQANARLVSRFVREVIGAPVILVGNSMGGLISILHTAAEPDTVAGVVLIDPALPLPRGRLDPRVTGQFLLYALPGLGEVFVRRYMMQRSPEQAVQQLLELCFADPSRANPTMTAAEIALIERRKPVSPHQATVRARTFLAASRSLLRVLGLRGRYRAMMAGIDVPVLLIGGEDDRLVQVAAMRQAAARNPRWESVFLAGVGHTPMLEVPDVTTDTIRDWLDRHFAMQT
ncbi:MAG TPA: alpha/beta hydrolase [Streptosporangiaceae bacterium]|jgi:pimeloyl-ACP methyl ester carboxylesterase|nr:alpha/beta hydrolase [Streptosporangiaceae bacterium]